MTDRCSTPQGDVLDFETWYRAKYRNEVRLFTREELHEAFLVGTVARSETKQSYAVPDVGSMHDSATSYMLAPAGVQSANTSSIEKAMRLLEQAAERIAATIAADDDGRTDPLLAGIHSFLNAADRKAVK